ncbi:hypothetical protein A0H81_13416 [Grifola frondosa]|uniref:Uncharacterized protein n=1 Tax=Grifola frondosa TaxID=5627 RepID=A0A1C7LQR5_GRIFR|nr:hypothetical protein A0H81_13416 [Grifola frondosa]
MLIRRTAWTQAIAWIGRLCNRLRRGFRPSYLQYHSPEDEQKYWMSSEQLRRVLQSSDANNTPRTVPLVTYYMPKLLPVYRSALEKIVFPGPVHPTIEQAARLVKHYSSRDRQEMYRISRMLTDEEVFGRTASWTPRYREMWRQWLREKGPDIAIVFE